MNTFSANGKLCRVNLHGHSTNSDGKLTPVEVCLANRDQRYDFTAVIDNFLLVVKMHHNDQL